MQRFVTVLVRLYATRFCFDIKKHVTGKEELSWWINRRHCDVFCSCRLHTFTLSSVESADHDMNGCNIQDGSSGVPGDLAALGPRAPRLRCV